MRRLYQFAQALAETLTELHENQPCLAQFRPRLSRGNPRALAGDEASGPGSFRLCPTNLDLQVFPVGYLSATADREPGVRRAGDWPGHAEQIGPATDVFHLALFCYYWLARLLPDGFAGTGLQAFSFHMPALRIFFHDLPPGLEDVLRRGPGGRSCACARPRRPNSWPSWARRCRTLKRRWTSRPKKAGLGNRRPHAHGPVEDRPATAATRTPVLVKEFAEPRRALLAVADGISICDVGNGALASAMTLAALEKNSPSAVRQDDFTQLIIRSCSSSLAGDDRLGRRPGTRSRLCAMSKT